MNERSSNPQGSEKGRLPLISVVMPCYNSENFLGEAIQSVINQTYKNWELFIIDDASTDHSAAVAKEYALHDARIHIQQNKKNAGAARTRNIGFDLCHGDYVALLDSDDIWYEEMLEQQIWLAAETKADILYCSYRMIDENGRCLWRDFKVPKRTDFNHMLSSSVISCSTVMLSKKITDHYRFPDNCYHEDLAFWLLLMKEGYTARGNQRVLAAYRLRQNSRASNKLHVAMERWHIYRDILHLSLIKSTKAFFVYAILGVRKYKKRVRKAGEGDGGNS